MQFTFNSQLAHCFTIITSLTLFYIKGCISCQKNSISCQKHYLPCQFW